MLTHKFGITNYELRITNYENGGSQDVEHYGDLKIMATPRQYTGSQCVFFD
ncbi:MAG: hypothetical protein ACRCU2_11440 [Planktothrix sp.]